MVLASNTDKSAYRLSRIRSSVRNSGVAQCDDGRRKSIDSDNVVLLLYKKSTDESGETVVACRTDRERAVDVPSECCTTLVNTAAHSTPSSSAASPVLSARGDSSISRATWRRTAALFQAHSSSANNANSCNLGENKTAGEESRHNATPKTINVRELFSRQNSSPSCGQTSKTTDTTSPKSGELASAEGYHDNSFEVVRQLLRRTRRQANHQHHHQDASKHCEPAPPGAAAFTASSCPTASLDRPDVVSLPDASSASTTGCVASDEGRLSRWFSLRKYVQSGGVVNSSSAATVATGHGVSASDVMTGSSEDRLASSSSAPTFDTDCELNNNECNTSTAIGSSTTCAVSSQRAAETFTSTTSAAHLHPPAPPMLPPPPTNLSRDQLRRRHVFASIVDSENNYVASLQTLTREYMHHLQTCQPTLISAAKLGVIFGHVPAILQCHSLFRMALTDSVRRWDEHGCVGEVFVASFARSSVLDVYSRFVNNFSTALATVRQEIKRKPAFGEFLRRRQAAAADRLSLFGLLVKPVQRFPQFILQLQDLLKNTEHCHPDRMCLQLALTQLETLAEALNESKREAEQCQALRDTLRRINGKLSSTSSSVDGRYLVRDDRAVQLQFGSGTANNGGTGARHKARRLILFNDQLLCVTDGGNAGASGAGVAQRQRLSLKWAAAVTDVQLADNSGSGAVTLAHMLSAGGGVASGGLGKSSVAAEQEGLVDGVHNVGHLCRQMTDLMHDYEVVSRIATLMGSLRGEYSGFSADCASRLAANIQQSIRDKDDQLWWLDDSCVQLLVQRTSSTAASAGGNAAASKEASPQQQQQHSPPQQTQTLVFQFDSPAKKQEWITDLRLAQLSLHENNVRGWHVPEHSSVGCGSRRRRIPLFVHQTSLDGSLSPAPSLQVVAGCFVSLPLGGGGGGGGGVARRRMTPRRNAGADFLWTCARDASSGRDGGGGCWVSVMSVQRRCASLKQTGRFSIAPADAGGVQSRVTCMCFVPSAGGSDTSNNDVSAAAHSVWLATSSGRLVVFPAELPSTGCVEPLASCQLSSPAAALAHITCQCSSPADDAPVATVFAGIAQAKVAVLQSRTASAVRQDLCCVGEVSLTGDSDERQACVSCLLVVSSWLYAGCGQRVYVVDVDSQQVLRSFSVAPDRSPCSLPAAAGVDAANTVDSASNTDANAICDVAHLAYSGIGLWVALRGSSTVRLYHTETLHHLQDIDVAASVARVCQNGGGGGGGGGACSVTCISAARGLLWLGTSAGVTVTVTLPRLGGLPIVAARGSVAYHGHRRPVVFICQLERSATQTPSLPAPQHRQQQQRPVGEPAAIPAAEESGRAQANRCIPEEEATDTISLDDDVKEAQQHQTQQQQRKRRESPPWRRHASTLPRGFGGFHHAASSTATAASAAASAASSLMSSSTTHTLSTSATTDDVFALYGALLSALSVGGGRASSERLRLSQPELSSLYTDDTCSVAMRRSAAATAAASNRAARGARAWRRLSSEMSSWSVGTTGSSSSDGTAGGGGGGGGATMAGASGAAAEDGGRVCHSAPASRAQSFRAATVDESTCDQTLHQQEQQQRQLDGRADDATATAAALKHVNSRHVRKKTSASAAARLDVADSVLTVTVGGGYLNRANTFVAHDSNDQSARLIVWETRL